MAKRKKNKADKDRDGFAWWWLVFGVLVIVGLVFLIKKRTPTVETAATPTPQTALSSTISSGSGVVTIGDFNSSDFSSEDFFTSTVS